MKKISLIGTFLIFASFGLPVLASAQNSDGCNSSGSACTNSGGYTGSCAQNPETGYFYCRPNILGTSGSNSNSGAINPKYLQDYKTGIIWIINFILLPVLVAVAFIVFLWGVYRYFILGASNESEKAEGRKFAMWGIIGFVIIFSVWSLVNLVRITLSLPNNNPPATPML